MHENKAHVNLKEFKKLYDRLYLSLCIFADKYLNNLEVSKDIVHDIFVKIWEDRISIQNENVIKAYLYNSVRNKSLNYIRDKKTMVFANYPVSTIPDIPVIEEFETEEFFYRKVYVVEVSVALENAISSLPKKCQQIMRFSINDYSNLQIAEKLNISINTVKAQKRIAYYKLRIHLKKNRVYLKIT